MMQLTEISAKSGRNQSNRFGNERKKSNARKASLRNERVIFNEHETHRVADL